MDHAVLVSVVESIGHLACDPERVLDGQLSLAREPAPKALAIDIGHDVVQQSRGLTRVVERQDVGMRQAGDRLDLTLEALGPESRRELGVEDFESYWSLMPEVAREVDRGHAAPTELALEHIAVTQGIDKLWRWGRHRTVGWRRLECVARRV
jgi:hypothetical protein